MAQFQRMDAFLDTLTTEMYQVNARVSRVARQQACLSGFVKSPSPSSEASEDGDDGGDFDGDGDKDEASSSYDDKETTAFQ